MEREREKERERTAHLIIYLYLFCLFIFQVARGRKKALQVWEETVAPDVAAEPLQSVFIENENDAAESDETSLVLHICECT